MNWYRKYPLFAFGLTVCGVAAVGELALIYERFAAARDADKRLGQRRAEQDGMAQLVPPPTRAVATAIEADLAKAQKALAAMQTELTGKGPAAERLATAKMPAARTDAYFDLATFVERTKELAEKNNVEVRPEAARFGFAKYANEGPDADRIEPVFRQRLVAEYLLTALLEARPRSLFSVKRARLLSKAEREAREAAQAGGEVVEELFSEASFDSPDYFAIDPRVSARVRGFIETIPFRFVFTGQTATLRNFLNRLASFELPVLVREVEVDIATIEETMSAAGIEAGGNASTSPETAAAPSIVLTAEQAAQKAGAKAAPPRTKAATVGRTPRTAATPIVSKAQSKYTVTVEYIDLVTATAPAVAEEQPAPSNQ